MKNNHPQSKNQFKAIPMILGFIFLLFIGWLDYMTGYELVLSVLYLIPVVIISWRVGTLAGFMISFIAAAIETYVMTLDKTYSHPFYILWDGIIKLSFYSIISYLISKHRQMEEKNLKFAAIVEYSDDGIIGKDLSGIITSWNNGAEAIYGYKADEIIGKPMSLLAPPERKDEIPEILRRIYKGEHIRHFETVRVRKDGTPIEVYLTISPIKDKSSKIIGASTIARDITEKKVIENALRQKTEELNRFFDAALDLLCIADKEGNFRRLNLEWEKTLGYSVKELVGKRFLDFVHPDDMKNTLNAMEDLNDDKAVLNFVNRYRGKDGSYRWIEWRSFPAGTLVYAAARDITERKETEEKLRQSNERLRQLSRAVEQSPSTVAITDLEGNITYVNPKFTQLTGYSLAEVVGKNPRILKSGEMSQEKYKELWEKLIAGDEWRGEFHNQKKDGELYWEFASISPIKNAEGIATHYIKVSEDITERKMVEKTKEEFVSMVSHELRTPLTAIKESIGIVSDGTAGQITDEQKEVLEIGKRNVDRLARLINDVLDFQKLQVGKMKFHLTEEDINTIVVEAKETMASTIKNENLEMVVELEENLPKISMDKDKITQVLINLLNNSIKFTEKGMIKIKTFKMGDNAVSVTVRDTGIGIKLDQIDKLFHAFSQVGPADLRKTGSSGLGLVISKEIIQQHKGKIWVESEYGKGSTFHIVIPITERRKGVHHG